MTWTRHWGIIGSIAIVQLGILVGYQALLTGGPSAASAGQVPPLNPVETQEPPAPHAPTTPPIKLPAMMQSAEPITPAPLPPGPQPSQSGVIMPVTAKEESLPVVVTPDESRPPSPLVAIPAPAPCPWNLALEIVGARTHLTAQNGKDVTFTVSCDKLDVQTPSGRIQAAGKVKVTSGNFEGTCERLTISWLEDVVVLHKVYLKCKLEGQAAELNAEELRLRLQRVVPTNAAASDWWDCPAKQ